MVTITYNGYTLPNQIEKFTYRENERDISISCQFLVLAVSESALVGACQAAETALTEINKDFSLSFGGSSEFNLSHAGNTGFLARPTLSKGSSELATGTSRPYNFSLNIQLPFSQTPYNYQREGSFSISYAPTRGRTVSFQCLYTAGGANSALDNYVAGTGGKAWAAGVLSSLGGNFELVGETIREEREEKILNATLTYKEILAKQSSASINVAAIVDPSVSYRVSVDQEIGVCQSNAGYVMVPAVTVSISYSCKIDFEQVGDEKDIEDVYQDTVKPWLIAHARDMLGLANYSNAGTNYIIQSESKTVDPHAYTVGGQLTFTAPKTLASIVRLDENITVSDEDGISVTPIWDQVNYTYSTWGIGAKKTLNRNISIAKLDTPPADPPEYADDSQGTWLRLNIRKRTQLKRLGVGTSVAGAPVYQRNLWIVTYSESYIYIVPFQGIV